MVTVMDEWLAVVGNPLAYAMANGKHHYSHRFLSSGYEHMKDSCSFLEGVSWMPSMQCSPTILLSHGICDGQTMVRPPHNAKTQDSLLQQAMKEWWKTGLERVCERETYLTGRIRDQVRSCDSLGTRLRGTDDCGCLALL